MLGQRLKEERERLGKNQDDFSALAGAKRRTLVDWEKGVSSPTATQLAALVDAGVDGYYVLTGNRVGPSTVLSANEADLIDNYRSASDEGRRAIEATSAAMVAAPRQRQVTGKAKINVGENHGQVIEGGQVNHGPVTFGQTRAKEK